MEWMSDRQEEMNAVLVSGNPMEAARISGFDQESPTDTGACIHGDPHGEMICERRDSLYWHRGVRVGEASHFGPNSRRRRLVSSSSAETSQQSAPDPTLLDDFERHLATQVDISSDEVLLMRPNCRRHVVPRIFQAVDASPGGSTRASGADHVFEATPQVCPPHPTSQAGHRLVVYPMGQRPTVLEWSGFVFRSLGDR